MPDILLHLLLPIASSLFYAVLGYHFGRSHWREKNLPAAQSTAKGWERASVLIALAIQGFGLYGALFRPDGMHFSFALALALMLWLAVLIYWAESLRSRIEGLQSLVLPIAAVCAVLPAIFPQTHVVSYAGNWGFKLHFVTAMLAYSLFTLSALHALFMGIVEQKLHSGALDRQISGLPPILAMEALLFQMIGVAFALLTVTVGSGVFFSEAIFGKPLAFDHKTVFAFAAWGIFAALLLGRRIYGWRGRIALRWTLSGFLLLFLAYIGSRFVSEVLLGRI